jgi:hypothetical protein
MLIACSLFPNLKAGAAATMSFGARIIETGVCSVVRRTARRSGPRLRPPLFASKISGDQIVRTPASAHVDLGSGGAYPITVGIEHAQKTRLIRMGIWLNAPQRAFVYEKRCLYRAIVSPKSHGMPRSII